MPPDKSPKMPFEKKVSRIRGAPGLSTHEVLKHPARFAGIFTLFFLCGFAVLFLPPVQVLDGRYSEVLVRIAHSVISFCGGKATVDGAVIRAPGGFAIEMKDGCNAVNVTILLWAAVIAFPAGWRMKLFGAAGGMLAIQAVNIVRFISLFYLGQYSVKWFDFAHSYLWESLIVLDTMVIFWFWVNRVSAHLKAPDVGA